MANLNPSSSVNANRYKKLRYSFIAYWLVLVVMIATGFIPKGSRIAELSKDLVGISVIISVVINTYYLIMLGMLVRASKKNVFLWVIGTIFFSLIGFLVSYTKITTIAMQRGWTPLSGDYKRAVELQNQAEQKAASNK